jgi:hypothetical protein
VCSSDLKGLVVTLDRRGLLRPRRKRMDTQQQRRNGESTRRACGWLGTSGRGRFRHLVPHNAHCRVRE